MAERSPEDGPQDFEKSPAGVDVNDPEAAHFRGSEPSGDGHAARDDGVVYRDIVVIGASAGGVEAWTESWPGFRRSFRPRFS